MGACNENGVYEADERLSIPRNVKGWRGCDLASIRIANLGPYWIWATSFQMYNGDHHGSSSPLTDHAHGLGISCRSPSRQGAIGDAAEYLRNRLTPRAVRCADARAVLSWLDTLNPDQLDLFGVAA